MTNPGTPMGTPTGGGMPKWIIILIVVLLVIIMGCCGGLTTCWFLARRAARAGVPALQQWAQDQQAAMIKHQQEMEAQARAQNGGAPMIPSAPDGAVPPAPPTPTPGDNAAPTPAGQKMPSNFPSDIPVEEGLTSSMSTSDNANGGGMVMLTGKVKTDDAATFYKSALEKAGYSQTGNSTVNDMTTMLYAKDAMQVSVQVTPGEGGAAASSNVMIIYGKK